MWHEQKIVVIQPGNNAENLRSGMGQVRSRFPMAQIVLLCAAQLSRVALSIRDVNQVLVHCAIDESGLSDVPERLLNLIQLLKVEQFDAAIVLPDENRSPYPFAYACYLAGIPVRLGVSCEFGGGVLSECGASVEDLLERVQEAA
ncbi:glycosyltransferase family 9 protein [Leptolyngbya sp. AN03gr2]|uniref:glycosyltransferase family 9 protein n=1 Tax=unclassified Leptolyngbya TaxID=2650499 RepID=UPI003D319056